MVIALICVISAFALTQFVLLYWRATVSVVAAAPISESVRRAAGIRGESPAASDFNAILRLHDMCPDLRSTSPGVEIVQGYYLLVSALNRMTGSALNSWAARELATCSRYVAARVDQRIAHNRSLLHIQAS
jgi:hypothetical protein